MDSGRGRWSPPARILRRTPVDLQASQSWIGVRELVVYSRRGCHLCEEMLEELEPLCRGRASLIVRDVDSRPEWADEYGLYVPVLVADGKEVARYRLNREAVVALLAAGMA